MQMHMKAFEINNRIPGIRLYVLLSSYICFISFLFLELYVLGDDASISHGSFMRKNIYCA